jgi:hypothetical protein
VPRTGRPPIALTLRKVSRSIRLTAAQWRAVDAAATRKRVSAPDVIRAALRAYLGRQFPVDEKER